MVRLRQVTDHGAALGRDRADRLVRLVLRERRRRAERDEQDDRQEVQPGAAEERLEDVEDDAAGQTLRLGCGVSVDPVPVARRSDRTRHPLPGGDVSRVARRHEPECYPSWPSSGASLATATRSGATPRRSASARTSGPVCDDDRRSPVEVCRPQRRRDRRDRPVVESADGFQIDRHRIRRWVAPDDHRAAPTAPATEPHLARQRRAEHPEVVGVAAHQPLRLAEGAVDPLQPGALHPPGRTPRRAGEEVQRPADADADRRPDRRAVAGDPALLLRVAEGHPDDVGAHGAQPVDELGVHRPVGADHGCFDDDDVHTRRTLAEHVGGAFGDPWGAAEQAQAPPVACRSRREGRDQVGAGGALPDRRPQELGAPHDAHPVGDRQVGTAHDRPQLLVGPRVDDEVDVHRRDLVDATGTAAGADHPRDRLDRLGEGDVVDGCAEEHGSSRPVHRPTSAAAGSRAVRAQPSAPGRTNIRTQSASFHTTSRGACSNER